MTRLSYEKGKLPGMAKLALLKKPLERGGPAKKGLFSIIKKYQQG